MCNTKEKIDLDFRSSWLAQLAVSRPERKVKPSYFYVILWKEMTKPQKGYIYIYIYLQKRQTELYNHSMADEDSKYPYEEK